MLLYLYVHKQFSKNYRYNTILSPKYFVKLILLVCEVSTELHWQQVSTVLNYSLPEFPLPNQSDTIISARKPVTLKLTLDINFNLDQARQLVIWPINASLPGRTLEIWLPVNTSCSVLSICSITIYLCSHLSRECVYRSDPWIFAVALPLAVYIPVGQFL